MEPQSAATPATSKKATPESATTPKDVTSTFIAEKDQESANNIDLTVTLGMTTFSAALADIKPTELTETEVVQEKAQRETLSTAVEVFIRSRLEFKAAERKVAHARFELGQQLAEFRKFYKADRTWGAVKAKLAEGMGYKGKNAWKNIDRIILTYETQKQLTRLERVTAERLNIAVTPDLVKELVAMQLKDGECKTDQDAFKRVNLASAEVQRRANKTTTSPLRESCVKALFDYLKTIAPDERDKRLTEVTTSVYADLEIDLEEEDESAVPD